MYASRGNIPAIIGHNEALNEPVISENANENENNQNSVTDAVARDEICLSKSRSNVRSVISQISDIILPFISMVGTFFGGLEGYSISIDTKIHVSKSSITIFFIYIFRNSRKPR